MSSEERAAFERAEFERMRTDHQQITAQLYVMRERLQRNNSELLDARNALASATAGLNATHQVLQQLQLGIDQLEQVAAFRRNELDQQRRTLRWRLAAVAGGALILIALALGGTVQNRHIADGNRAAIRAVAVSSAAQTAAQRTTCLALLRDEQVLQQAWHRLELALADQPDLADVRDIVEQASAGLYPEVPC